MNDNSIIYKRLRSIEINNDKLIEQLGDLSIANQLSSHGYLLENYLISNSRKINNELEEAFFSNQYKLLFILLFI
jgi:hypothetical protein